MLFQSPVFHTGKSWGKLVLLDPDAVGKESVPKGVLVCTVFQPREKCWFGIHYCQLFVLIGQNCAKCNEPTRYFERNWNVGREAFPRSDLKAHNYVFFFLSKKLTRLKLKLNCALQARNVGGNGRHIYWVQGNAK